MKIWKKVLLGSLALVLGAGLAACGSKDSSKDTAYTPKELKVQFVPSSQADKMEAKAKPLEKLLSKELGIPVKVSVSTDYNTIVEAMGSKQVDVGFLPPDAYVMAHKQNGTKVLLQAERYKITQPGGENSTKLVDKYRSMVVVKKGSGIKTIDDLKGKKIAVQDTTSASGFIFPAVDLMKKGVNINKNGIKTVQVKGHDQGVMSVLNGDTDAAFVFEDARNIVKKDVPDIMDKVEPIYFTQPIPNDTISVRKDMSDKWQKKIQNAFIDIAKSKKGHKIVSEIYSHEGYTKSKDSNFDLMREYSKDVKKLTK
ncbi:phosphonate ABC transporter substrate-binding protein [Companilactobacillus sp. RD055328]|uniref:phosphate/phosphite/phosphonate ABC transporter substrate-binding protein n=1 Tax=Companilactobacillus sp. RD055328 TaxID=2916634 RepID=UPI001FC864E0|nr:phosphate/phosphite/phosphonate ABC transporter substrate-binding protein [Companilactobacillus sp. RD055328]GKQ43219.1 phosphonate ABC transporter substrate-binding protein [Companilactobacillus sp. RD055328]